MRRWAGARRARGCLAALTFGWAWLRLKTGWRRARPECYARGPPVEIHTLDTWDDYVNSLVFVPPFRDLPFTPTLPCEPEESGLLSRYDWQVRPLTPYTSMTGCGIMENMPWYENTFEGDPRTVWAVPHALERVLELAERHCDPSRNDRVIHFAGSEMPLEWAFGKTDRARNATVARLRKYFHRIAYMTKDIELDGVHAAPMGLSWGYLWSGLHQMRDTYLSPTPRSMHFRELMLNASTTSLSAKTRGVLATRSRVATWLDADETWKKAQEQVRRRPFNLISWTKTNSSIRSIIRAYVSRLKLRKWVLTPEAKRAGVDFVSFDPPVYWREMPKYRFLLNPMGSNVQTAKTYEALLALTIPVIVHEGYSIFRELQDLGFPLVVIGDWAEVTPERLEHWWASTSPRLESFRRNCLTVDGYFRMITGQVRSCH